MFSTSMGQGTPQAPQASQEESKAIVNINSLIDTNRSECANASSETPFINILQSSDAYTLKSDCDEQLLFNLYFQNPVRVHHMVIRAPSLEVAPLAMKTFINRAPMGFDDVESIDPIEEIEILEGELQGDIILSFVKYQNVSNLTIFIENNRDGGDVTEMSKLELYGSSLMASDMGNFKKVQG
jgi:hypothetical protein